jgi:hypothetical protein
VICSLSFPPLSSFLAGVGAFSPFPAFAAFSGFLSVFGFSCASAKVIWDGHGEFILDRKFSVLSGARDGREGYRAGSSQPDHGAD